MNSRIDRYEDVLPSLSDSRLFAEQILRHKTGLLLTALLGLLAGTVYYLSTPQTFESSTLIKVDRENSFLENLFDQHTPVYSQSPLAKEETRMLRSRAVIGAVVDGLDLTLTIQPIHFPILSRLNPESLQPIQTITTRAPFNRYSWGNQSITVGKFSIPDALIGEEFLLTVNKNRGFSLSANGTTVLKDVNPGETLVMNFGSSGSGLIRIEQINANPGARYGISRLTRSAAIDRINAKLEITTQGVGSRVIELNLKGENPQQLKSVLDRIIAAYQTLQLSWNSREAQQELKFLNTRLPVAEAELESSEAALANYQQSKKSIDISTESQILVDKRTSLEKEIASLNTEKDLLHQQYTSAYPEIKKLNSRISSLNAELGQLETQIWRIPAVSKQLTSLQAEVKANREIFDSLNERYQKLIVAKASSVSNIRLIDSANTPEKAIWPKAPYVLLFAVVLTPLLYILYLWFKSLRSEKIRDSESLERLLGLPALIDIPHSARAKKNSNWLSFITNRNQVLALTNPKDQTIETMRAFRAMLTDMTEKESAQSIMICGPLPQMGKSFVIANLAALLVEMKNRVLLVDGDCRRGNLHNMLGLHMSPGLTDLALNRDPSINIVQQTAIPQLDLISKGSPDNLTDGALQNALENINGSFGKIYDYILIDAPPILCLSAAAVIGRFSGTAIMVIKSDSVTATEAQSAVKRLELAGVHIAGCLVNSTRSTHGRYAYD